ncbi:hypothetical protein CLOM_g17432 [Closterium sp. NIES-68]|nr:hypothetical protein CLOM_g17432 [Closterium sp. NIES-68]GJP82151.1 hypothetical protein CLOP_g12366 [Closterium sp. NIES-67]
MLRHPSVSVQMRLSHIGPSSILTKTDKTDARIPARLNIGCSLESPIREKHPHSVPDSRASIPDCNGPSRSSVTVSDQNPSTSRVSNANAERVSEGDGSQAIGSGKEDSSLKPEISATEPLRSTSTSINRSSRSLQRRIQARLIRQARKNRSRLPAAVTSSDADGLVVDGYSIGKEGVVERLFWLWGRWLYQSWFAQETRGTENLPLDRGIFFMACNHSSHLDCGATFVGAWTGGAKRVYALGARDYFFSNPLLAWFVTTCMHVIPINRCKFSQQELDTLLQVKATSGPHRPTAVLIFPEGTRSVTGSLQPFKSGVGLLAEQLDIPVVPVCVKGTFEALPKGRTIPLRRKITVEFGRHLDIQEYIQEAQTAASGASAASGVSGASGAEAAASSATAISPECQEETQRAMRRATHRRFAEDLRGSVANMMGRDKGTVADMVGRDKGTVADMVGRDKGSAEDRTAQETASRSEIKGRLGGSLQGTIEADAQGQSTTGGASHWPPLIAGMVAAASLPAVFGGVSPEGLSRASYAAAASLLDYVPQPGDEAVAAVAAALCCALLVTGLGPAARWAQPYLCFPSDDNK